jgi:NIMA (never in mitosis gene a)-related kinase
MRQLDHPNIVTHYDSFVEDDTLHIVMELMNRGDLSHKIERLKKGKGSMNEAQVWDIVTQILPAIAVMHNKRILHRDIKPANIFCDDRGIYKIGDLGLGRVLGAQSIAAKTNVGTPLYMSPEVCGSRPYNDKADIWSLGCLLYEVVRLHPPFRAKSLPELHRNILTTEPPSMPPQISDELRFLVSSMLVKDPARRPSARDIMESTVMKIRLVQNELNSQRQSAAEMLRIHKESMSMELQRQDEQHREHIERLLSMRPTLDENLSLKRELAAAHADIVALKQRSAELQDQLDAAKSTISQLQEDLTNKEKAAKAQISPGKHLPRAAHNCISAASVNFPTPPALAQTMINLAFHWRKGSMDIGSSAFERRLEFGNHWVNKEARKLWSPTTQRWAFFIHTSPNLASPLCISQLKVKTTQDRWQLLQAAQPVQLEAGRWFCEVDVAGTSGQPVKEFMVDMDPANAVSCVVIMLLSPSLRDLLSSLGVTLAFEATPTISAQTPKRGTDAEAAACTPHADLILQSLNNGILLRLPISGKACRVSAIENADSDAASDLEGPALSLSSSAFNTDAPVEELRGTQVQAQFEPLHNTPMCKNDVITADEIEEDRATNVLSAADAVDKPPAGEVQFCAENSDGCQRLKGRCAWMEQLETPVGKTRLSWVSVMPRVMPASLIILQPGDWIQFWSRLRSKTAPSELAVVMLPCVPPQLRNPELQSLSLPRARSSRGHFLPVFSAALFRPLLSTRCRAL